MPNATALRVGHSELGFEQVEQIFDFGNIKQFLVKSLAFVITVVTAVIS